MADKSKYYYMKLKEDFFYSQEITVLEGIPDGYLYSNILLKMYLASLRSEGRLMFKDIIPYSPEMIASVTRHQVGTVEKALRIFEQMGLIEVLDNGAIYMSDIQNFIGQSSDEADRKRDYRRRIEKEKGSLIPSKEEEILKDIQPITKNIENMGAKSPDKCLDKCPTTTKTTKFIPPTVEEVEAYCTERNNRINAEAFVDYYEARGWFLKANQKMKNWKAAVRTWERNDKEQTAQGGKAVRNVEQTYGALDGFLERMGEK